VCYQQEVLPHLDPLISAQDDNKSTEKVETSTLREKSQVKVEKFSIGFGEKKQKKSGSYFLFYLKIIFFELKKSPLDLERKKSGFGEKKSGSYV